MRLYNYFFKTFLFITIIQYIGCKKLVDGGTPPNRTTSDKVYNNDALALAAVNGIYREINSSFGPLNGYITFLCAVYSDELKQPVIDSRYEPFLTNNLDADVQFIQQMWTLSYKYIYQCNDVLEGLQNSTKLADSLLNQLSGEAYFLRALNYIYLVNLFGDVPLITVTDFATNARTGRTQSEKIYNQIISDLTEAQKRLTPIYYSPDNHSSQRVRANRLAATALLARAYLYKKDWAAAENAATQLIESPIYKLETNVQQVYLSTSKEAILQFMPFSAFNSAEGATFIPQNGSSPSFVLNDSLLKEFESGDKRRNWIKSTPNGSGFYPFKFQRKDGAPYTEYNMVLRLGEQYLIRAEARVMQNNLKGAADDINIIRARAGLALKTDFNSQQSAIAALEQERRIELFAEWGHRWFDLRRMPAYIPSTTTVTRADEVLGKYKPTWEPTDLLWPLPARELTLNSFLVQNIGY